MNAEWYIEKITRAEALEFLGAHHYLRGVGGSAMIYALRDEAELFGVCAFQRPCSENVCRALFGEAHSMHVTELSRLALSPRSPLPASAFVSRATRAFLQERERRAMTPIYALISFADSTQAHHGGVYQAMSWLYLGESVATGHPRFVDSAGRTRHRRQNGRVVSATEARERGWRVIPTERVVKHRYLRILGSSRQRRALRRALRYPVLPYPKPTRGDRTQ